jgi:hypothetical protein
MIEEHLIHLWSTSLVHHVSTMPRDLEIHMFVINDIIPSINQTNVAMAIILDIRLIGFGGDGVDATLLAFAPIAKPRQGDHCWTDNISNQSHHMTLIIACIINYIFLVKFYFAVTLQNARSRK